MKPLTRQGSATLLFLTFACTGVRAAPQYFDFDVTNNLTPGAAAWDAGGTAAWANSATPGTAAPVVWTNGSDAFFQTGGVNTVALNTAVIASSLTQAATNTATTISGTGTLTLSTGNLTNSVSTALILNQAGLTLGATGTVNAVGAITIGAAIGDGGGGFGLTKSGGGATLTLGASNTFSGPLTITNGNIVSTFSGTGTPFGTGSLAINGAGGPVNFGTGTAGLWINPLTAGATTLTGGTASGSQLSFANTAYINLTRNNASSPLTFTYGSGSGTVLNRVDRGVMVLMDNTSDVPASMGVLGGNNFLVNGTAPTVTNGMVSAYYLGGRNGGTGQGTFMTYDGTYGFKPVTYDVTNSVSGWTAAKKVTIDSKTITTDSAAYALRATAALTLGAGVTVSIGDNGTTPAGLILHNNISGGTIDFGASEAVVYLAGNLAVSSAISGSNGLTKTQYAGTNGALSLSGTNSYTGVTTINTGILNAGAGGTSGDLGGSTSVALGPGAILGFNRSDTTSWSGTVTGLGTVQKSGTGDFTLTLNGNQTFGTVQTANTAGLMTLTTAAPSDTVNATLRGTQGGNMAITSGNWITPNLGVNTSGAQMRSKLTLSNAAVTVGSGRYTAGSIDIQSGGTLAVQTDRFTFATEQVGTTTLFTLDIGTGGTLDVYSNSFGTTIGGGTGTYSALVRQSAGIAKFGVTNGVSTTSRNLVIGGTGANVKAAYDLSGGTLLVRGTVSAGGAAGTGGINNLNFRGGVLAAANIATANLGSTDNTTDPVANSLSIGTLVNRGGTLAPGDVGTTGLTAITGNYSVSSGSLAIDLAGTTASSAFQDLGLGKYDQLTVAGTLSLGGTLSIDLMAGYSYPLSEAVFKIVDVTGTVTPGSFFTNVANGGTLLTDGGEGRFKVYLSGNDVYLSEFTAVPEPGAALLGGLGLLVLFRRRRS